MKRMGMRIYRLTAVLGALALGALAGCDSDETTNESAGGSGGQGDGSSGSGGESGSGGSGGSVGPVCGDGTEDEGEECDDGNTRNNDDCVDACTDASCGDGYVNATGTPAEDCDDGNAVNTDSCTDACKAARCGDGYVGPGEACDDGNNVDDDACSNTCTGARCGDGILQPDEECDDANADDQDECLNTCLIAECGDGVVQTGQEACDDGNANNSDSCTDSCEPARCGDGYVGPGEACDDGNSADNDACTNACKKPECGDSIINGTDECDDGNQDNEDGCLNTCLLARCGDGFIQADSTEECDDGNQDNADACLNACVNAKCGDTVVRTGVEGCDDGNTVDDDGCTNSCKSRNCGNGTQEDGEECDDGNAVDNDACSNNCFEPKCGDGITQTSDTTGGSIPPEEDEECDDGNAVDADNCRLDCQLNRCGDGVPGGGHAPGDCTVLGRGGPGNDNCADVPEECDDGNGADTDGCLNNCRAARCGDSVTQSGVEECDLGDEDTVAPNNDNFGDDCTQSCMLPKCGDGYRQNVCIQGPDGRVLPGQNCEECDDGNAVDTDSCLTDCREASCGDRYVWQGVEACDDGNVNDLDACTNDCALDSCGNGAIDAGEECDNIADDQDNNYADCTPRCMKGKCGDNFRQYDVEDCDDGNQLDNDDCVATCKQAMCGDGKVNNSGDCRTCLYQSCTNKCEECDDGNHDDQDGCTNDCETAECGDGIVQAGTEECDDGVIDNADLDYVWHPLPKADPLECDHDDDCADITTATGCSCDQYGTGCPIEEGEVNPVQGLCGYRTTGDGQADGDQDSCTNDCQLATCGDGIIARHDRPFFCAPTGAGQVTCAPLPSHQGPIPTTFPYYESCDDGNTDDQDFCSNTCKPSTCSDGILHEGIANPDDSEEDQVLIFEKCDDDNTNNTDRCLDTCVYSYCGDGHTNGKEECDDGNHNPADGCSNTCRLPYCGDGIVQKDEGEECDLGGVGLDAPGGGPNWDWPFCNSPEEEDSCLRDCSPSGVPSGKGGAAILIAQQSGDSCFFVMASPAPYTGGVPGAPLPGGGEPCESPECGATYREAAWSCYQIDFWDDALNAPLPYHPSPSEGRTHLATPASQGENDIIVGMLNSLDQSNDAWIGLIPLDDPQWDDAEPNPTGRPSIDAKGKAPGIEDINCVGISPTDGAIYSGPDDDPNPEDWRYRCSDEWAGNGWDNQVVAPLPQPLDEDRRKYVCEHEYCTGTGDSTETCATLHPRGCWDNGQWSDAQNQQNICDSTVPIPMEDDTGFLPWCYCDTLCATRNDCCRNRTTFCNQN